METIYSSKIENNNSYIEIGVDRIYNRSCVADLPVLYVYKDGNMCDVHITDGNFADEMKNTIDCYISVHKSDPSIKDISIWRQWYRQLKELDYIK